MARHSGWHLLIISSRLCAELIKQCQHLPALACQLWVLEPALQHCCCPNPAGEGVGQPAPHHTTFRRCDGEPGALTSPAGCGEAPRAAWLTQKMTILPRTDRYTMGLWGGVAVAAWAPVVAAGPARAGCSLTTVTFTNMTFLVQGHPSFPEDNAVCECCEHTLQPYLQQILPGPHRNIGGSQNSNKNPLLLHLPMKI